MERHTRQRQAVLDALARTGQALSPPEILALSQRAVPSLNLSTVYRQIRALQDQDEVVRVDLPGQPARFEVCCRHSGHTGHTGHGAHAHDESHAGHARPASIHALTESAEAGAGAARGDAANASNHTGTAPFAAHHHHHFHCVACERVFTLHNCTAAMDSMTPPGFELQRHDLTLHGRCQDCVLQASAAPASGNGA